MKLPSLAFVMKVATLLGKRRILAVHPLLAG
jgi:hypothetical protein